VCGAERVRFVVGDSLDVDYDDDSVIDFDDDDDDDDNIVDHNDLVVPAVLRAGATRRDA